MRRMIARILTMQSKRFLAKNTPRVIVVAGSAGKSSATSAVESVLGVKYKVRATISNYNTDVGVPCSIFGRRLPENVKNPLAWLVMIIRNEASLLKQSSVEVLVLELGTDTPGEIAEFAWLNPELAVVTAVAEEHMEYFKTVDAVAEEELSVVEYSKKVLINKRMVAENYRARVDGADIELYDRDDLKDFGVKPTELAVAGEHSLDAVVAALTVGKSMELTDNELIKGAKNIRPKPGRMNLLAGVNDSILIDDTYNSSPVSVRAALDYLYGVKTPQRIALLGNMNELGEVSRQAHIDIGEYCDPDKLDLIVTLGVDANQYTAVAAKAHECEVVETNSPYEAGRVINEHIKEGAYVLLKGSQNGVFAEEAVRLLLANPEHESKLVRQNVFWKIKKQKAFADSSKDNL